MRGLPREVKAALTKAQESALLAVETYNRPGTVFRSGAYIVLMVIAWTALFHAIFLRIRVKPFHIIVKRGRYVRYEKVDGDNKAWELAECMRQFYEDHNPPVSSGPHHQDSGEAKIRESTAGVSRKPSSDGKARGCSSKHVSGLTAWNT